MENIFYFMIAVVIMFIFSVIDGISHKKFKEKTIIIFHIFGMIILLTPFTLLLIKEFKFSLLFYPGVILILFGFLLIFLSFKQIKANFITARIIIKNGLYAYVRHPMHLGTIILFIGLSLFSSSLLITAYSILMACMIFWLTFYEEWYLTKKFKDYEKYKSSVPMLIPRLNLKKKR